MDDRVIVYRRSSIVENGCVFSAHLYYSAWTSARSTSVLSTYPSAAPDPLTTASGASWSATTGSSASRWASHGTVGRPAASNPGGQGAITAAAVSTFERGASCTNALT